MQGGPSRSRKLKFADLITTLMSQLDISHDTFCTRFGISFYELEGILDGKPVNPDIPLRLAATLDWSPEEIDDFLAKAGPIPLSDGIEMVTPSTSPSRKAANREEHGPLLRALIYVDPLTCRLERVEVLRSIEPFDQSYADRHLLGRKWAALYSDDFVESIDNMIRSAGRGESPPPLWGEASDGMPGSLTFRRVGALVEIRYEIHAPHIHPIANHGSFTSLWKGMVKLTKRP